ncbi:hypothetical protein H0E84_10465 [Luteimonas sp. SJ-92]|uniref:Uncharacterized protein n=1 Tax=Luteimonas salinisoli TaxID=2752307 RepID=A0A853JDZ2_9GAMM|nr:hypothetical protein [Luteimonas salinisoli]NZA26807.1 hypothetical protein [Luteimonas salinisoli]
MLLEFIAIIAAGFGLAGLVLALNFLVRKRLPGWAVPAAAGGGMLAMAVWLEYSWLDRVTATFPDEVEVASTNELRVWYRPWTFVVPQTSRLIAIDHRFDRHNAAMPDQVLTQVLLMGRWEPARQFGAVFDCAGGRRADLVDEVVFDEDGAPRNARWIALAEDDSLLRAACSR